MKKYSVSLKCNTLAYYIFLVFMAIVSIALFYYSGFYTSYIDTRYYEIATPHQDSIILNLLFLVIGITVLLLLAKLIHKLGEHGNLALLIFDIVLISTFSLTILLFSHSVPCADQAMTIDSGLHLARKSYAPFQKGGYLYIYPHQVGFALYCKTFIKLFPKHYTEAIQFTNIIWNALTLIVGYRLIGILTKNSKAKTYFLALITAFLPLFIYVPFVYGEMIMVALTFLLAYLTLLYIKKGKIITLAAAVVCSFVLVALRMNSLIPVFACSIALLMAALKKHALKNIIAAVLIFIAGATSLSILFGIMGAKANTKINGGVPLMAHVAVGFQDCICSPGWSNNWNLDTYKNTDFSEKETDRLSRENIKASLIRFKKDPKYTWHFFTGKFSSQWNEPSFEAFQMVYYSEHEPSKTYQDFYFGKGNLALLKYMNRYLFLAYSLLLFFVVVSFKKRDYDISQLVLMIASFGGMLFHMIWEAKSRYTMPFFVMLIPYMALSAVYVENYLTMLFQHLKKKFHKEPSEEIH